MRRLKIGIILAALLPLLPACRPAPSPPTPSPAEIPSASETSVEKPKPPEADRKANPTQSQNRIARLLPESILGAPEQDSASRRLEYNTLVKARPTTTAQKTPWQYRVTHQGRLVGFEFSNHGGNAILPPRRDAVKNQFFTRDFQFRFDERARQDIYLMVSDWAPSRDRVFRLSEVLNSLMIFFPRSFLPSIVNVGERTIVTLPTGEDVDFNAQTYEIRGGALTETPVDLNPDRAARHFPGISYQGKGVVIRVNSRGTDPRIGQTAIITRGAQNSCTGQRCGQCQVSSKELWDQGGAVRFKFPTDAQFDRFLSVRCGFGLDGIASAIAVSAVQ